VRPSLLYVVVPALPRGSLVEIEPLCLDVEALAVGKRFAGENGAGGFLQLPHAPTGFH
jgi:hypothetical protein